MKNKLVEVLLFCILTCIWTTQLIFSVLGIMYINSLAEALPNLVYIVLSILMWSYTLGTAIGWIVNMIMFFVCVILGRSLNINNDIE